MPATGATVLVGWVTDDVRRTVVEVRLAVVAVVTGLATVVDELSDGATVVELPSTTAAVVVVDVAATFLAPPPPHAAATSAPTPMIAAALNRRRRATDTPTFILLPPRGSRYTAVVLSPVGPRPARRT